MNLQLENLAEAREIQRSGVEALAGGRMVWFQDFMFSWGHLEVWG